MLRGRTLNRPRRTWRAWALAALLLWAQTAGVLHALSHAQAQLPGGMPVANWLADGAAAKPESSPAGQPDDAAAGDGLCQVCLAFAGLLAGALLGWLPRASPWPQRVLAVAGVAGPRITHCPAAYGARAPPAGGRALLRTRFVHSASA